jgi:hypothetical protein
LWALWGRPAMTDELPGKSSANPSDTPGRFSFACQIATFLFLLIVIELLSGHAFVGWWAHDAFVTKAGNIDEYWSSIFRHSVLAGGFVAACITIRWWRSKGAFNGG